MSGGKESDRVSDKTPSKPERGSEAEQQASADAQAEAPAAARQDRQEKLASFLEKGTMGGLAGIEGTAKFEITGEREVSEYDEKNPDIRVERARLRDNAEAKITDPAEKRRFQADMAALEARASELEELYRKQNPEMSPEEAHKKAEEEIAKTYHEVSRMMEGEGKNPLPETDRMTAAKEVMHQAADPTSIDQGYHGTCNVSSMEARIYTRDPAAAAKLVADVATNQEYTAPDGTTVSYGDPREGKTDSASVKPQEEGVKIPDEARRSYASQLFQVTAVNLRYKQAHDQGGEDIRYEQHPPQPGPPPDTGERLMDYGKTPPEEVKDDDGKPQRGPGFGAEDIAPAEAVLTGRERHPEAVIGHADVKSANSDMTTVHNEQEFEAAIARAKENGQLPVVIRVHSGNEPFLHDSGGGKAGGSGGWHVVTVTDYTPANTGPPPEPAKVEVDNQWGEGADHQGDKAITAHDLYMSTRKPDSPATLEDMRAEVERNRDQGEIDTAKEIDLLRAEHRAGTITDEQYARQLADTIREAGQRWLEQQAAGNAAEGQYAFDPADYEKAEEIARDIVATLPPDQAAEVLKAGAEANMFSPDEIRELTEQAPPEKRLTLLEAERRAGLISDKEFDAAVAQTIRDARERFQAADARGEDVAEARQAFKDQLSATIGRLPKERIAAIVEASNT
jgi:hypothetical protein